MIWNKDNMFEPSGCLTREAFEALVDGILPAEAIRLANEHMASCPFCSDALEGFESQKAKRSFPEMMATADTAFDNLMAERPHKPDSKRIILLSVSAAASILLIVGLFYLIRMPDSKIQVAENIAKKDTITTKPAEEPAKSENAKVEKKVQQTPSSKEKQPEQVLNTARFTPPNPTSDEVSSEPIEADKLKENSKEIATAAASESKPEPIMGGAAPAANRIELKKSEEQLDKKSESKGEYRSYSTVYKAKTVSSKEDDAQPLAFAEQMPEYPGGQSALTSFLNQNLQYPKQAGEMGITGSVFVSFMVTEDGTLRDIKIIRGLGGGCDEEAVRVVKLMPKWIPGKQNGRNVKTYFTLPVKFNLQSK